MLANLFGTTERLHYIFRDSLAGVEAVLAAKADPAAALKHPLRSLRALPALPHMLPRRTSKAPVLENRCALSALPRLVGWPMDGGPFITLPLVYSEDPARPGPDASNLGMYRVQLAGNDYAADEVGLHYQIHRGIGVHHAEALKRGQSLPVNIFVGGPPAFTVAAVMPLPEGLSELRFAGLLGGCRAAVHYSRRLPLPVLAEADFCISGHILPHLKPEGPFGDHVGYYSLKHDFPVLQVEAVHHRTGAIWPYTAVGRPPQEDTVFGDFIHELTGALVPQVFQGVREVHAVDAAGVHPLLLALGSERYTPYEAQRRPRELLTAALHMLGTTQTALAKYVLVAAHEDAPGLRARDVVAFFRHLLERTDFERDLHFITRSTTDTLDYTGFALNEGSKLIWASAGEKRRELALEVHDLPSLPDMSWAATRPTRAWKSWPPAWPTGRSAMPSRWWSWRTMPPSAPRTSTISSGWPSAVPIPLPTSTAPGPWSARGTGPAKGRCCWMPASSPSMRPPWRKTPSFNAVWMPWPRRAARCTALSNKDRL